MLDFILTMTADEVRILGSIVATTLALPTLLTLIAMALK